MKQNIKNYKKYKKIIKKRKVFGIGMMKTGISSLSAALMFLGYKVNWLMGTEDGKLMMEEIKRPTSTTDYRLSIMNDYDAMVGIASATWFEQYDRVFPGAKFILHTRDLSDWLDSSERWWASTDDKKVRLTLNNGFVKNAAYGSWEFNKDRFEYLYHRHHREVVGWFKRKYGDKWGKHLLVINFINNDNDERKWKKIVKFLKLPNEIIPEGKMFSCVNINTQIVTDRKKIKSSYGEYKKNYIEKRDKKSKSGKYEKIDNRWIRIKTKE